MMKCFAAAMVLLGSIVTLPTLAFESTTDIVVRSLYASQQVSSSFSNDKIVLAAQSDAATFVASEGVVRGAHIEAAFNKIRMQYPDLKITDIELAEAILVQ